MAELWHRLSGKEQDYFWSISRELRFSEALPRGSCFPSNRELPAARSIAMLELLTTRFGLPASRLAIAGYADNMPLQSNATEAGRARNRRADVVALNKVGVELEPGQE